jgi:hypothetical protein
MRFAAKSRGISFFAAYFAPIQPFLAQIGQLDQRVGALDQELTNLGPPAGQAAAGLARNLVQREQNAIIREQRRLGPS